MKLVILKGGKSIQLIGSIYIIASPFKKGFTIKQYSNNVKGSENTATADNDDSSNRKT